MGEVGHSDLSGPYLPKEDARPLHTKDCHVAGFARPAICVSGRCSPNPNLPHASVILLMLPAFHPIMTYVTVIYSQNDL